MPLNYYVSPAGNDTNSGTESEPFKSVTKGISVLLAGNTLNIFSGKYFEEVRIAGKAGTEENPILIQGMPGHTVIIENTLPVGRTGSFFFPNTDWRKASETIPEAHPDEYVSTKPVHNGEGRFFIRGMFLSRLPYTRLITYSNQKDFRSNNETFEKIFDGNDAREKVQVTDASGQPALSPMPDDEGGPMYPFCFPQVYMGPGIWPNPVTGHLHIRLSHTHNNITGLADYSGTTDPRRLPLGIAFEPMFTLRIAGCSYVTLKNIHVRYGGETTIQCENNRYVTLDTLTVLCGSNGLINSKSTGFKITNCVFDGGMPSWYFRSDRKSEYHFTDTVTGEVMENNLGKNTVLSLFILSNNDVETEITNNEFLNGHDCTLKGEVEFSKNYIRNLNDDALFISEKTGTNAKIYQNVFTSCLYCISLAESAEPDTAPVYIYRNLFDLREPTAGFRPRRTGDNNVWRTSMFLKFGSGDIGIQVFHNTFIAVSPPALHAVFGPFTSQHITQPTGSFNNLFAVSYTNNEEPPKALSFIPPPNDLCKTDGNFFYRASNAMVVLFRNHGYSFGEHPFRASSHNSLAAFKSSTLFTHSQTVYEPGFEANSKEGNPKFKSVFISFTRPQFLDDFRLKTISPAKDCGIALPAALQTIDIFPAMAKPAAGCYPLNSKPLLVGVRGRKRFPAIPL